MNREIAKKYLVILKFLEKYKDSQEFLELTNRPTIYNQINNIPMIEAYVEGKDIEVKIDGKWQSIEVLDFNGVSEFYRIANNVRPWEPEEAIGKIVRKKDSKSLHLITWCYEQGVGLGNENYTYEQLLEDCICIDGHICGVKIK